MKSKLDLVTIKYKLKDNTVKLPEYKHAGDAGMDIYSNEDIHIKPAQTVCVMTGLFLEIPIGYYIKILPRSGISLNTPLRIANSPATIDCGYRGELGIIVTNTSDKNMLYSELYNIDQKGNVSGIYKIKKGDRIAQIVCAKYEFMMFEESELSMSNRGIGGFGSTGIV